MTLKTIKLVWEMVNDASLKIDTDMHHYFECSWEDALNKILKP